ncbi:MAG: ABC-F family ATP-binding cassette domain-containing protein [Chloroflexi bacterium]|nr:ABC-F family ATP-binding cassette domain-containing protein [Chloroflexota bacterium]
MLHVTNLGKRFPDGPVLERVSFVLDAGEKLGLVGPNGSGKTTLLRLLAGEGRPSAGSVTLQPGNRAGYLAQFPAADLDRTVGAVLATAQPELTAARAAMDAAAAAMADPTLDAVARTVAITAYSAAAERFETLGGYDSDYRIERVRAGLALDEIAPDRLVASLSGGQKTRLSLARLLLAEPSLLLLDEPTNYLDLPALLWLERYVATSPCAAIIVSHDRRFLDRTVSGILELDPATRTISRYAGGYSAYVTTKRRERERHTARYQDQVERVETVEREIGALKGRAQRTESSTINFHYRKVAKGVARRAKVQERRLQRFLDSEERLERPEEAKRLFLADLGQQALADDRLAVAASGLRAGFDDTLVLDGVNLAIHGGDRLALVGANGSGKSTLLRALAGDLAPVGGVVRYGDGVRLGYLPQEHHWPPDQAERSVLAAFRAGVVMHEDEARAFLDKFLFGGDTVHRCVADLSYGERARLALAVLVGGGANALLLDEPTSHLDLDALDRIESALAEYAGPLVVASHDRYFLDAIGITGVLLVGQGQVRRLASLDGYEALATGRVGRVD